MYGTAPATFGANVYDAGLLLAACSSSSTPATTTTAPPGGTLSTGNAAYLAADLKAPAGALTAAGFPVSVHKKVSWSASSW